jgi:hypothetical protein
MDIEKFIAYQIEKQFPSLFREEGTELVALIKYYYEFLETDVSAFYVQGTKIVDGVSQTFSEKFKIRKDAEQRLFDLKKIPSYSNLVLKEDKNQSVYNNRRLFEFRDIDNTLEDMVIFFKNKYMKDLQLDGNNTRFIVKNILDLYRRRGTPDGVELFFRLFYNENIEIYYPSEAILKPSTSSWNQGIFLQLYPKEITELKDLTGRSIYGSISKAEGIVNRISFTLVNNALIPILFLSSVKGNFIGYDDIFSIIDGTIVNFGIVYGSLDSVNINQTDPRATTGNEIGDLVNVTYAGARGGKAIVTDVSQTISGEITYEFLETGFGYTEENTLLLVSNQIIFPFKFTTESPDLIDDLVVLETVQDQFGNVGKVIGGNETIFGIKMDEGMQFTSNSVITTTRAVDNTIVISGAEIIIDSPNIIIVNKTANNYFSDNDIYYFDLVTPKNDSSPGPLYPETANTEILSVKLNELDNEETVSLIVDIIGNFLDVQLDSVNYNDPPALTVMSGNTDPVDANTPLNEAFNLEPFTIGSIKKFINIKPGTDYKNKVFAVAYDPVMKNFDVYNQIITLETISATLEVGSIITQGSGPSEISGKIIKIVENTIFVLAYSYYGFTSNPITFNGNNFNVLSISRDYSSAPIGFNANINAITEFAVGKILNVEVTNSGYGYGDKEEVTITDDFGDVLAVGVANARGQGRIEGRWSSKESHLNFQSGKVLQDSDYYQEYSYEIQSQTDINTYKSTLTEVSHLAGTKIFGKFVLKDEAKVNTTARFSIIRNT